MKIQSRTDFEKALNGEKVKELENAGWKLRLSPLALKHQTLVFVNGKYNAYRIQGTGALRKQSYCGVHIVREAPRAPGSRRTDRWDIRYGSGVALLATYEEHLDYLVERLRKGTLG